MPMTYAEKLRDPRWLTRRSEIIELRGGCCQECAAQDELQVHHVTYIRGREPWEYPDELLLCLCRTCHLDRQVNDEEARFEFARMCANLSSWQVYDLSKALRYLNDGDVQPKLFDAFHAITGQQIT